MKRLTLIIASGAIGLALLLGATHDATATMSNVQPGDGVPCYYNLYYCSYQDSMGYWSGCDPQYAQGLIPTATAKVICATYHDQ
ncbi:MAG TPA: hypothetical protein VID74_05245 [Gemmatimonadales bacterium]|jgi:endo-beta-N-acetylglucosaminidase D